MPKSKGKKSKFVPLKEFELNNSTSGCNVSLVDPSNETKQSVNLRNKSSSFEKSEDLSMSTSPSNLKPQKKNNDNRMAKKPQNLRKHQRQNNFHKSDNYGDNPEQNVQKNTEKCKTNATQHGSDSTSVEDQPKMIDNKRYIRKNKFIAEEAHNLRPSTSEMTQDMDIPSKFFGEPKSGQGKDINKGDFRTENITVNNFNQIPTTEDNGGTSCAKNDYRRQENNNYHERQSRPYNSNYNSEMSKVIQKQPYVRKPYKQITPNDKGGNRESYQKNKHFYNRNWSNRKNRDKDKNWQSNNEDPENWDTDTLSDTNNSNTNRQERSWNEYKEELANRSPKDEYVESSYTSKEESCTEGFEKKPANTSREDAYQQSSNINRSKQEECCVNKFAKKPTTTYIKDECEESKKVTIITQEKSWAEQCEEELKGIHDEDEKFLSNQDWESEIAHKTQEINIDAYDCSNTSRQKNNQNRRSEPVVTDRTFRWNVDKPRHSDTKIQRRGSELYDKSFEKEDKEYAEFNKESLKQVNYGKTKEQQQDLFMMPKDYSLAHCVAEDFRMGSGIAVQFKRDFKEVANLLAQRQKQGGLAILENETKEGKRYIYYLVTKTFSTGKPTYESFWSSLKKMRNHIRENKVTKLAIPRLGCGLDRLEWSRVKSMIEYLFKDIDDMDIVICNFQQSEDSFSNSPQKDYFSCKVVNAEYPLVNIEPGTMILYFTTEKGEQTKEMETLNGKFSFRSHHNSALRHLGQVIKYEKTKNYILYGCVVRKAIEDLFDFESFGKCLAQINKDNKKDLYEYVGITPVEDAVLHEQILTLMKTMLKYVSIYVCRDNSSLNSSDNSIKIKPSTN